MSAPNILNYELAPSPATIFGCLLPAPWLGVAAGLLLAFGPAAGLPDRYSPLVLAVTHVLVLGMLAPIMVGALFQLFPVVAGQVVRLAKWIAPFVAVGSATIAAGLSAGFLQGNPNGFVLAAWVAMILYGAIVLALVSAAWRMFLPVHPDATLKTLRGIALALSLVIGLGVALAGAFAGWWQVDIAYVLRLHVAWGLVGWIASLVLGVASTVVPMFWQTRRPSPTWHRHLPWDIWLGLLILFLPLSDTLLKLLISALALFVCVLAWSSLRTLLQAKRSFDPAWTLWLVCAASWGSAAILLLLHTHLEHVLAPSWISFLPWWIGVLSLVGGAVMPVNAMLGKIIPFLIFLHLRRQIPMGRRVPSMQVVLPPERLRWQTWLVCFSLFSLLLLPLAPEYLKYLAGLSFAASQAMLAVFLLMSLFRYRRELRNSIFPSVI
ncbi:hypothetical protein [Undibacterium flavidum]|uniref:Transmembrane protein n=1 Tax=Undibacterium flavidum TaxID=2762297 RepID=A0ABR6Y8B3_9BURK|nr:hypothetical protein [Undibacterium flavidum]MBC3872855.1 hypothetical protein [Undibacterium flavidum]